MAPQPKLTPNSPFEEFVDIETAKTTGRKRFGKCSLFFRHNPGCRTLPPLGYRNNVLLHAIEIDETKASVARRMFDLILSKSENGKMARPA